MGLKSEMYPQLLNYEDGEPAFLSSLGFSEKYGAGVVIGTIDEEGMGRTAEKKFQIAKRA
ncbi:MAG UNVERIFIED_CONTAM: hypothetical protein LVR29_12455 [Microcystis novacekii LVE1205-3]